MTTHPFDHDPDQPNLPKVTIWGMVLLILGGPNWVTVQERPTAVAKPPNLTRYAVAILLASILELTLLSPT